MKIGALADWTLLLKIIAPPGPVILCTSNVHTGITGKTALGKPNVTAGDASNGGDPVVIVNWQLCEYPEKFLS